MERKCQEKRKKVKARTWERTFELVVMDSEFRLRITEQTEGGKTLLTRLNLT